MSENKEQQPVRPVRGPGGRGMRGPRPKIENPGKLFARVMNYVLERYKIPYLIVILCIFISVYATIQGTMFMKTLIDVYITPMLGSEAPDFGPLAGAIGRVAVFYLLGAVSAFVQARLMIYISQGTLKDLREDLFTHMESLPIKYFDTHSHGDIMSIYTWIRCGR